MIKSYQEFWPFYVREHSKPATRLLHFAGTTLGVVSLVWFIWRGTWYYFPLSFVIGYAFAWFAHFVVEPVFHHQLFDNHAGDGFRRACGVGRLNNLRCQPID